MAQHERFRPTQIAPGRGPTVGTGFRVAAATMGVTFALLLGAPAAVFPLTAQELTLIPDPDAAATCGPDFEIALERVVRVRDSDADPWLGEDFFASTGPDGRIYATSFDGSPGVISVLDDTGDRDATWGRQGEGPGEGRWVRPPAFGPGDTAYAYDPLLGRVTLWTLEGDFVRTMRVPPRLRGWNLLDSGNLVMWGLLNTPGAVGLPVHIFDRDGGIEPVRSFGLEVPYYRSEARALTLRLAALAPGRRIWLAHLRSYIIEEWDLAGRKLREIRRVAGWFPPWSGEPPGDYELAPPGLPQIRHAWEDDAGRLWVVVAVADASYQENYAALEDSGIGMGRISRPEDRHGLYDTTVEVLELSRGCVLASRTLPWSVGIADGADPLLIVFEPDQRGGAGYDLYRLELTGVP